MARSEAFVKSFVLLLCIFAYSDGRPLNVTQTAGLMTLITTSYVETIPAFIGFHSSKLDMVDGNPCITVEAAEGRDAGNLMARKTCWCMTVIEVPITPTVSHEMTATFVKTPVYTTTTVTVFASSYVETTFETTMKSDVEASATQSSSLLSELIPEGIISTPWPGTSVKGSSSSSSSSSSRSSSSRSGDFSRQSQSSFLTESDIDGSSLPASETTLQSLEESPSETLESFSPTPEILLFSSFDVSPSIGTSFVTPSLSSAVSIHWQSSRITSPSIMVQNPSLQVVNSMSLQSDVLSSNYSASDPTASSMSARSWFYDETPSADHVTTATLVASSELLESIFEFETSSNDYYDDATEVSSTMTASDQSLVPPLWTSKVDFNESRSLSSTIDSVSSTEDIVSRSLTRPLSLPSILSEESKFSATSATSDFFALSSKSFPSSNSSWDLANRNLYGSINSPVSTTSSAFGATLITRFPPWTAVLESTREVEEEPASDIWTLREVSLLDSLTTMASLPDRAISAMSFEIFPTPTVLESSTFIGSKVTSSAEEVSTLDELPGVTPASGNTASSPSTQPSSSSSSPSSSSSSSASSSPSSYSVSPTAAEPPFAASSIQEPSLFLPDITMLAQDSTSNWILYPSPTIEASVFSDASPSPELSSSLDSIDDFSSPVLFPTASAANSIKPLSVSTSATSVSKHLNSVNVHDVTVRVNATQDSTLASTSDESLWTDSTTLTWIVPSPAGGMVSSVRPSSPSPTEASALQQDPRYWIQTELAVHREENSTDFSKLANSLALLYERVYMAEVRRQRRQLGTLTSITLIRVGIDFKDRVMKLIYVLLHKNRFIPAVEAVEKMRTVRETDMEKLIEHGVIVKAKPFESTGFTAPLEDNRLPYNAWIIVFILLSLLLLLLCVVLYLCVRNRNRQKAEVKDAEVSSSFSQGEGKFSKTTGITLPGESIRSYRDAVTSPVHFGGTGTYRRSESPRFYENQAFESEAPKHRKRPNLTQHTFEASIDARPQRANAEVTQREEKPQQGKHKGQQSSHLSAHQNRIIPAKDIEIRPVVSEVASEDETPGPSEEQIEAARHQLESMTERLNALVDNSLTVEQAKTKLHGSYRQKLLISRKDYKRSRSADSTDKYLVSSAVSSVSNPIFKDQPTQTNFPKKTAPPHFLVTIHKEAAAGRQRSRTRWTTVDDDFESTRRVTYREPTTRVIEAIKHELDLAQEFPKESFA